MKLLTNSNYELRSYIFKVISQLVCEIISFENVIIGFRSRNEHRVMCLLLQYSWLSKKILNGISIREPSKQRYKILAKPAKNISRYRT